MNDKHLFSLVENEMRCVVLASSLMLRLNSFWDQKCNKNEVVSYQIIWFQVGFH